MSIDTIQVADPIAFAGAHALDTRSQDPADIALMDEFDLDILVSSMPGEIRAGECDRWSNCVCITVCATHPWSCA
ncbi:hypothetical protein FH608_039060 [Nonomuraea phyllanthi]|uniref:Uncharacterized protein n=1 Tax=Nonomuraea phyllanthi TaxID=2219224 RepID=A0A5C4VMP2_9ACTN|nr:hypothetical protein [Nonomuraea phyllanthi]KAB8189592.1 hypothetical protein FH608_039060 [Nonomuraea phyllanthi]QFY12056.1 hypothetical protein GBF35_40675 [Nonomuraea phyllanthi]